MSTDDTLEAWIESRKRLEVGDVADAVMRTVDGKRRLGSRVIPVRRTPSWAVAFGCFLAGTGKLGLVLHCTF